jgi:hypothetical protein
MPMSTILPIRAAWLAVAFALVAAQAVERSGPKKEVTRLHVLVRAKEDGAPQVGVRVNVSYDDEGFSRILIEDPHGEPPLTDVSGCVELEVEPGRPLEVDVRDLEMRGEHREIVALALGEARGLVLEFPTAEDIHMLGQLVAIEDDAPLQGRVKIVDGAAAGRVVETDEHGRFEISAGSWDRAIASAEVAGRAPAMFPITYPWEDRSRPRIVRLWCASAMEVAVSSPKGTPLEGAGIELRCEFNDLVQGATELLDLTFADDPVWKGRTDPTGHATIEGLPPNVPLHVSVSRSDAPRRDEPEPLLLEAGERGRIDVVLGQGTTILGRLQDEKGAPIRRRTVWRVPAKTQGPGMLNRYWGMEATDSTKTDAKGHFQFRAVAAGTWWIGPAPVESSDLSPAAQAVSITNDQSETEVVVQVQRGLYLRGHLLDPAGVPIGDCSVHARWIDGDADESARSMADGSFAIGPLVAGRWSLSSSGYGGIHADSLPVEAEAGSSDILVQLRAGGEIRGEAVDPRTGIRCECELGCGRVDAGSGKPGASWIMRCAMDGEIDFGGLLPGRYVVTARTRDGRIAAQGNIEVHGGETVEGVHLELATGAKLSVCYEGSSPYARCRVFRAETLFDTTSCRPRAIETIVVPAGAIELRWRESSSPTEHLEALTVSPGEERTVTLRAGAER